jgi:hypothetical protein
MGFNSGFKGLSAILRQLFVASCAVYLPYSLLHYIRQQGAGPLKCGRKNFKLMPS